MSFSGTLTVLRFCRMRILDAVALVSKRDLVSGCPALALIILLSLLGGLAQAQGESILITAFELSGNQAVADEPLRKSLADFIGKPITAERLENIRVTVFETYSNRGYLSRISFPEQDLSSGVILIKISEKSPGDVTANFPEDLRFDPEKARAFLISSLDDDSALSINEVDQFTKNIDNLAGISATVKLRPRENDDRVDLDLGLENTALIEGTLQTDNLGAETTGRARFTADLQMNSLLSQGEKLALGFVGADRSQFVSFDAEFPLGFSGATGVLGTDRNFYDVSEEGVAVDGRARSLWLRYRAPEIELAGIGSRFEVGYEYFKTVEDFFSLPFTDKVSENIYATLSGSWINESGTASANVSARMTGGDLDLTAIPAVFQLDQEGPRTHGRFYKLNVDGILQTRLSPVDSATFFTLCQWANKNLDSDQELALSGPTAVRAYDINSVKADLGCYLQNELARELNQSVTAFLLADVGYARTNRFTYDGWNRFGDARNTFWIAGIGGGIRVKPSDNVNFSFTYARRVGECKGCSEPQDSGRVWALGTASF